MLEKNNHSRLNFKIKIIHADLPSKSIDTKYALNSLHRLCPELRIFRVIAAPLNDSLFTYKTLIHKSHIAIYRTTNKKRRS
jgi:hypothetical protein